jgi:hypothetical protein
MSNLGQSPAFPTDEGPWDVVPTVQESAHQQDRVPALVVSAQQESAHQQDRVPALVVSAYQKDRVPALKTSSKAGVPTSVNGKLRKRRNPPQEILQPVGDDLLSPEGWKFWSAFRSVLEAADTDFPADIQGNIAPALAFMDQIVLNKWPIFEEQTRRQVFKTQGTHSLNDEFIFLAWKDMVIDYADYIRMDLCLTFWEAQDAKQQEIYEEWQRESQLRFQEAMAPNQSHKDQRQEEIILQKKKKLARSRPNSKRSTALEVPSNVQDKYFGRITSATKGVRHERHPAKWTLRSKGTGLEDHVDSLTSEWSDDDTQAHADIPNEEKDYDDDHYLVEYLLPSGYRRPIEVVFTLPVIVWW